MNRDWQDAHDAALLIALAASTELAAAYERAKSAEERRLKQQLDAIGALSAPKV